MTKLLDAHPAPALPARLTDEQIDKIADDNRMGYYDYVDEPSRYWRAFARAILNARPTPESSK